MHTLRSKGFLPELRIEGVGAPEMSELPPILRVLLVQDGTVTKTLEAWFWEPIMVVPTRQEVLVWTDAEIDLPLESGCPVLLREVGIIGRQSGRCYCRATSHIMTSRLPDGLGERLLSGEIGIGELLRDRELETYRELRSVFWLPDDASGDDCLGRSYLIHLNHAPVILIREHFPLSVYQSCA